jgi:hypothetical protein
MRHDRHDKDIWEKLLEIERLIKMTVDQPTFDAALATLVSDDAAREQVLQSLVTNVATIATDVTAIDTALTKFIADYNAKSGVDLTNELASVTDLTSEAVTDATALSNAVSEATAAEGTLTADASNVTSADPNA